MRKQLSAFVLGVLVAAGAYQVDRLVDRRRPAVFVDDITEHDVTLVFRFKGERLATTLPITREHGPAYTTRAFVWNLDLTDGPELDDVQLYAQDITRQSLPWRNSTER